MNLNYLNIHFTRKMLVNGMVIFVCCLINVSGSTYASDATDLLARYQDLIANVADNPFHAPLTVESKQQGNKATAEVYGVFDQPYQAIADTLGKLSAWCDFMPLSLNIKACTWQASPPTLNLFIGKKEYQSPDEAREVMHYSYRVTNENNIIKVELNAPSGSTWTKSSSISVVAMGIENGKKTIVHFSSSLEMSDLAGPAVDVYLATLGRNRIGFSTEWVDGKRVPIKGVKGMVERNSMRYYLALRAYLEQSSTTGNNLFERSAAHWFDLTEKYTAQLHELSKDDYMAYKKHERYNQVLLQKRIK